MEPMKDERRHFRSRPPGEIPARAGLNFHLSLAVMTDLSKPEVIITHESDLDGLLAGVLLQRLAKKLFGATVPLEAYHYNQWKQRDLRERAGMGGGFHL